MYECTADRVFPARLVYSYDFNKANDRAETSYYHKNMEMNKACAKAIDEATTSSCYKPNHYNLDIAAMSVISRYGLVRVNAVFAHHIQKHEHDGRYSRGVKRWASHFVVMENTHYFLSSHATLIDGFAAHTRKMNADLGAKWIALPGQEEHDEDVNGYTVTRAIMVDDNLGYAIAHNPEAVNPWVCWQFYIRDGQRDYNCGIYGEEPSAIDAYNARLFVAFN